ncbi:MAG: DUF3597 domain-containing protein [Variovorax sp.]
MSIFGNILSKIFPSSHAANTPAAGGAAATTSAPTAGAATPTAPAGSASGAAAAPPPAITVVDVEQKLDSMPGAKALNWRTSIVDLMKLLGLDSSLESRKQLAQELSYGADTSDSAKMNIWLHRQVMTKLAANGGKVPAELRD